MFAALIAFLKSTTITAVLGAAYCSIHEGMGHIASSSWWLCKLCCKLTHLYVTLFALPIAICCFVLEKRKLGYQSGLNVTKKLEAVGYCEKFFFGMSASGFTTNMLVRHVTCEYHSMLIRTKLCWKFSVCVCVTTIVFLICQVMTVVGGMARQKQSRLLKHLPHIIVATPGRLWELIEEVISIYC